MRAASLLLFLALAMCLCFVVADEFDSDEKVAPFLKLHELGADESPLARFAALEQHGEAEAEQDDTAVEQPAMLEQASKPWHRGKKQPVNRNGGDVQCLDGDCTRATKVKKAKVGTHPNASTPKPPTKLEIALGAVKEEIMVRAKELHLEKDWSKKVAGLIDEYQQKLAKVENNIVLLRQQTKALLRRKKQIQNVQVQKRLREKLALAQADLNRLQKQMEHVASKEYEFSDTEKTLKSTMNALKNSLRKLRGQTPLRLEEEGISFIQQN